MKNVIVVSAHPDDETLGAGGTILKHINKGDKVYWVIVTSISVNQGFSFEKVQERKDEILKVQKMYGFTEVFFLNFPTMTLSSISLTEIIPVLTSIFTKVKPEIIYSVNRSDAHSDHRIVFDALIACTKSFRHPYIKKILMYECISETEFAPSLHEKAFLPNYFVDISKFLDSKLKIMKVFKSEIDDHPFPRSIENIKALAHFRGASVGVNYAEAFQLLKYIDK